MAVSKFTKKLQGARVLIVGGTSGIGFAVAEGCLEAGCTVHIASSSPEKVARAVTTLKESYELGDDRIQGHVCSLNNKDTVEANIIALLDKVGELDHVVHTAGDIPAPPSTADGKTGVHAVTIDDLVALGMVRLFAAQILAKHAVTKLKSSPRSSITVTTGAQGDRPYPGMGWATATAAAITGLTRGLAVDLAPVRVNAVSLGPVRTPIFDRFPEEQRAGVFESLKGRCLTGGIAEPEDAAEAYLYLLRDNSCTGTVVHSDCGMPLT